MVQTLSWIQKWLHAEGQTSSRQLDKRGKTKKMQQERAEGEAEVEGEQEE